MPDHYKKIPNDQADIFVLNWKNKNSGDIFFPNSSWGEGRSKLYQEARKLPQKYLYYIFIDDDITFRKGDWREFESKLLKHKPAIGCASWEVRDRFLPRLKNDCQKVFGFDGIYNAFHKDVIDDNLVLPLINAFDSQSWWTSQFIMNMISSLLYPHHVLQINSVIIQNNQGRPYPRKITLYGPVKWLFQHVFNFNAAVFKRVIIHQGTALYFISRFPEKPLLTYKLDQNLKESLFREEFLSKGNTQTKSSWDFWNQLKFDLRYGIRLRISELVLEILARVPKFS